MSTLHILMSMPAQKVRGTVGPISFCLKDVRSCLNFAVKLVDLVVNLLRTDQQTPASNPSLIGTKRTASTKFPRALNTDTAKTIMRNLRSIILSGAVLAMTVEFSMAQLSFLPNASRQ